MTDKLRDDLAAVVRLSEHATDDGPWEVDAEGDVICNGEQVAWPICCKADAPYIVALNNFLRTHHAEILAQQSRIEAFQVDAARLNAECKQHLTRAMENGRDAKKAKAHANGG